MPFSPGNGQKIHSHLSPPPLAPHAHIDPHVGVALAQIVQDAGLIQESHVRHVVGLVEFGWVHLLDIILLHSDSLGEESVKTQQELGNRTVNSTSGTRCPILSGILEEARVR